MISFFSSYFSLTILSGIFLLFVYLNIVFLSRWWKVRHFPGPFPLPIVGNLYDRSAFIFIRYITTTQKKFGKYFIFWRLNTPMLIISDPAVVRQILSDTKTFVKGTDYTEKFAVTFGNGLVTSVGEKHRRDRSIFAKYFTRSFVETRIPLMNDSTKEKIQVMIEPVVGKAFDAKDFFHMLTLQIFGQHGFSFDYSKDMTFSHWLNNAVCWGSSIVGKYIGSGLSAWAWNFVPEIKKLKEDTRRGHRHFDSVVDDRIEKLSRGEAGDIDDLVTAMLNENLPRESMHEHLITLMAAGHDTTAFAGCYMSHLLAQNPRVQKKLKEEVKRVMGERTEVTKEDVNNLEYMKKVIQETLRLFAVIPIVIRDAAQDVYLKEANLTIPKGVAIFIPLFLMNRDSNNWENPSEFIPERFEGIDGISSPKHGYLPFGYGSRTCIGNQLAFVEISVMFTHILQKYTIFPNPNFKPQIVSGISLVSKNGMEVILQRDSN